MSTAKVTRVVISLCANDRRMIIAKARKLHLAVPELLRRGALSYRRRHSEHELGRLADAARLAAERAGSKIDSALDFVEASNARIAHMERLARSKPP